MDGMYHMHQIFSNFYLTRCKEIPSTSSSPAYKNYQMSSLKFYDEYQV